MHGRNSVPEWVSRGKTIKELIKEIGSFENQDLEVRISTDDIDTHYPISLVGKHDGACLLIGAAKSYDPARQNPVQPDNMDALVAAPEHHKLMFENERVRVLETRIPPGEKTPVHTHCWPGVLYFLSFSHFVRRDGEGNVMVDTRAQGLEIDTPAAMWGPPLPPHSLENVGDTDIRVVGVEFKMA